MTTYARPAPADLALSGAAATLVVYEGAPHGITDTHKDRLNADLLTFLRGVSAAAPDKARSAGAGRA